MTWWASKVLARTALSNRKSRPSAAACCVMWSVICCASSTEVPYFFASRSAYSVGETSFPAAADGAPGSSSKDLHSTSTASRCGNRSSAASNRRLPMWHQGQTTSDQISTFTPGRTSAPQPDIPAEEGRPRPGSRPERSEGGEDGGPVQGP